MTAKPQCDNCEFHMKIPDIEIDEVVCRRYPPSIVPISENGQPSLASRFPAMKVFGWCGEYRADGLERPAGAAEH